MENDTVDRWIRARITVTDADGKQIFFTDVGAEELAKIKKKYRKVQILSDNDWGRYLYPRNEVDEADRKEMKRILKSKS
jgi:hypothetical protein